MSSNVMTVVALLNGMIGSSMLILPILTLHTGILNSLLLVVVIGVFSWYACQISMMHMHKKQEALTDTIDRHLKRDVFPLYDIFSFISDEIILYLYFNIIMRQWDALFFRVTWLLPFLPYLTVISLIAMSISFHRCELGISLMAYGIVSIVVYLLFVVWMFGSRPMPVRDMPIVTPNFSHMAATLSLAISIQTIFYPILRKNKDPNKIQLLLIMAFVIGLSIYAFIIVAGSYGIIDRIPVAYPAETVMEYFHADRWQPLVLSFVYLSHLYTVWPERCRINKTRLMKLLGSSQGTTNTTIYYIVTPVVAAILYLLKISLSTFVEINGGVCVFFISYVTPVCLHLYCVYFSEKTIALPQREVEDQDEQCRQIRNRSMRYNIAEGIFLGLMILCGVVTLIFTLNEHVFKKIIN